jgi:hypothetical protein
MGEDACQHGSAIAENDVSRLTRAQRLGEDHDANQLICPGALPDMSPSLRRAFVFLGSGHSWSGESANHPPLNSL